MLIKKKLSTRAFAHVKAVRFHVDEIEPQLEVGDSSMGLS